MDPVNRNRLKSAASVVAALGIVCLVVFVALRLAGSGTRGVQFADIFVSVGTGLAVVGGLARAVASQTKKPDQPPPGGAAGSAIPSWPPDRRVVAAEVTQILLAADRICRGGDPASNGTAGPFVGSAIDKAGAALEQQAEQIWRHLRRRGLDPGFLIPSLQEAEGALSTWSPADSDGQLTRNLEHFRRLLLANLANDQDSYLPENARDFFRDAQKGGEGFARKWAGVLSSVNTGLGRSAVPSTEAAQARARRRVPDDDYFVGRAEEMEEALNWVRKAMTDPGRAVLLLTGEQPGVGVSAMTKELARRLQLTSLFPGGVLYFNLYGLVGEQRMTDTEVALEVLAALDVTPSAWPLADYEAALRGKRVLLVLDDAKDGDQVSRLARPILTCCVMVTSRNKIHRYEHSSLEIGSLSRDDSVALLKKPTEQAPDQSQELSASETQSYRRLARYCGRLPMALRPVGAKIARRPTGISLNKHLRNILKSLRKEPYRLSALEGREQVITTAIKLSYDALDESSKQLLRMCHAVRKYSVTSEELAFCLDQWRERDRVEVRLANLADISLARQDRPYPGARSRSYSLFELVRLFADERRHEKEERESPEFGAEFTRRYVIYMRDCLAALSRDGTETEHEDPRLAHDQAPAILAVQLALENGWDDLGIPLSLKLYEYLTRAGLVIRTIKLDDILVDIYLRQGQPVKAAGTRLETSNRLREAGLLAKVKKDKPALLNAAVKAGQQALDLAHRHELPELIPSAELVVSLATAELGKLGAGVEGAQRPQPGPAP